MQQKQDGTVPGSSNGEVRTDFKPEPSDPDQKPQGGAVDRTDTGTSKVAEQKREEEKQRQEDEDKENE